MPSNASKGGASAPSPAFALADTVGKRVVRLPTAQRRQVKQPCNKAGREARLRLRNEQCRRFDYVFPSQREAKRKIAELRAMPPTAAVNFVRNIIDANSGDDSRRAIGIIKVGAAAGDPFALEVKTLLEKVVGTTVGEQSDFLWVRARMAEEVR